MSRSEAVNEAWQRLVEELDHMLEVCHWSADPVIIAREGGKTMEPLAIHPQGGWPVVVGVAAAYGAWRALYDAQQETKDATRQ